jgi:hypothetical protein
LFVKYLCHHINIFNLLNDYRLMSQTDVLNSIGEGFKWVVYGGAGVLGYYYSLCLLQMLNGFSPFNEKIKSQEHMEKVVEEEAGRLGLDSSRIRCKLNSVGDTSVDRRDYGHILFLDDGFGCTRGSVKHELYHIKKGDCNRKKDKSLHYYLVAEPRATMYQVFGLKL